MIDRNSSPRPPRKAPGWSHQTELGANVGRSIEIEMKSGDSYRGFLVGADPFSIKIAIPRAIAPERDQRVIFKHDISSYGFSE